MDGYLEIQCSALVIQGIGVGVAAIMGFVGTFIILKIIDYVIGLKVNDEEELLDWIYHSMQRLRMGRINDFSFLTEYLF